MQLRGRPAILLLAAYLPVQQCAGEHEGTHHRGMPTPDTPHFLMDFESRTRQIPGHDFKQKPLHFQLPSQEQRRKAITLYGMLPAVEEKRMDVLFEWRRNDESASWMDLLDPDGPSGLKCQFPKLEAGKFYTTDIVPRNLIRKIAGRTVFKGACAMPRTAEAQFRHGQCINVTIIGRGVPEQRYGGKHVILSCPSTFEGHAKLIMCMNTPLYGFPILGSKIAQWIEYYSYLMNSDVHFFIYLHRYGTPSIVQGLAPLSPYIRDGLVTIVWEDEWTSARFFSSRVVPHQENGNHCLSRAKHHSTWIANTIDVDEYIAPFKFDDETGQSVWSTPLPAPPNATGLLNLGAILDKADEPLPPKHCPLRFPKDKALEGCKVNVFDMYKWAVQPVAEALMNSPTQVGNTLTPANGKHIMRTSAVAIMAIHTEVAFEESVDWNTERIVQTLSNDPQRWKFIKHRSPQHLSNPVIYPGGKYPYIVEYQMLHFNNLEWDRWVVDKAKKLAEKGTERIKTSRYRLLDDLWKRIELNLAARYGGKELFGSDWSNSNWGTLPKAERSNQMM